MQEAKPRYSGKIGEYFAWEALVPPALQDRLTAADLGALRNLVWFLLDPLRKAIGGPVIVTSGFRDPETNARVGGSPHSQHLLGEAADVSSPHATPDEIAALAQGLGAFKIGVYEKHVHLSIPSRDLVHHAEPAEWRSTDA